MAPFPRQSIIYELTLTTCTAALTTTAASETATATTTATTTTTRNVKRKKQHVSRVKMTEGGFCGFRSRGRGKIYSGNRILNAAWEFSPFMVAAEMGQLGEKRWHERMSETDGEIATSTASYASVISLKSL